MPFPTKSLVTLAMLMSLLAPLPGLASTSCKTGVISEINGKFGPWAMPQKMVLIGHTGRTFCDVDVDVFSGGATPKVEYHTELYSTKTGSFGGATYSVKLLPIMRNGTDQLVLYQWSTGGDGGSSSLKIISLTQGHPIPLLRLREIDGELGFQIQHGLIKVTGERMTTCMACAPEASASWKWDPQLDTMALVDPTPKSKDFARYLSGPTFTYGTPPAQFHQSLVSAYQMETQRLQEIYNHLQQTDTPQQASKLKSQEISWIIAKRRECGPSLEALQSGHEQELECLIRKTKNRVAMISPYTP